VQTNTFISAYPGLFILLAAVSTNVLAQLTKFLIDRIITKKWDIEVLFSTGGMPSSHTAFVISTLISVGLVEGVTSVSFALAFVIAVIVIHDALSIRRQAGKQAMMINRMVDDFLELTAILHKENIVESDDYNKKLKEFLGHEPIEVLGGAIFGSLTTFIIYALINS